MKNRIVVLAILVVFAFFLLKTMNGAKPKKTVKTKPVSESRKGFIKSVLPFALALEKKTGIPARFVVAQTALETRYGDSGLFKKAYNIGGIKAQKGQDFIEMDTIEFVNGKAVTMKQRFAKYKSVEDGLAKYAKLLNYKRYRDAPKTSPEAYARYIAKAGYSTNPKYAETVIKTMDSQKQLINELS